jgi:exonuclease SbcD
MFRLIHTADWHLGARLIDHDRHAEHAAFLDWLLGQLGSLRPDLLVVAGDIFDTATPPQEALQLYYRFLARLAATVRCRVLILGGNHDSPATLHAPRDLLAALDIRVVATPPADPAEALLVFPEAVVCAAPFLRERDLRTAAPGQSPDEIAAALRLGINQHYRALHAAALSAANDNRPLIATGHLTAVGGQLGSSERSIHIGNLGAIDAACFAGFAYAALGHIHRAQPVGGLEHIRYSGSPLPLSFSEVEVAKEIRVIDVADGVLAHRAVAVPEFRPLLRLSTSAAELPATLARHAAAADAPFPPWIELTVTDGRAHPDLDRQVREATEGRALRILKVLAPALATDPAASAAGAANAPSLQDLTPEQVFAARLRDAGLDPASDEGRDLALTFEHLRSRIQELVTTDAAPPASPALAPAPSSSLAPEAAA